VLGDDAGPHEQGEDLAAQAVAEEGLEAGRFPGSLRSMADSGIRQSIRNFREYDAPLGAKLRMALGNNMTKLRTRSQCCGHPGHPGC
jgi:hypothetical protein